MAPSFPGAKDEHDGQDERQEHKQTEPEQDDEKE
jgi:hypothetical protein